MPVNMKTKVAVRSAFLKFVGRVHRKKIKLKLERKCFVVRQLKNKNESQKLAAHVWRALDLLKGFSISTIFLKSKSRI